MADLDFHLVIAERAGVKFKRLQLSACGSGGVGSNLFAHNDRLFNSHGKISPFPSLGLFPEESKLQHRALAQAFSRKIRKP